MARYQRPGSGAVAEAGEGSVTEPRGPAGGGGVGDYRRDPCPADKAIADEKMKIYLLGQIHGYRIAIRDVALVLWDHPSDVTTAEDAKAIERRIRHRMTAS
jgi:hypothetical protein